MRRERVGLAIVLAVLLVSPAVASSARRQAGGSVRNVAPQIASVATHGGITSLTLRDDNGAQDLERLVLEPLRGDDIVLPLAQCTGSWLRVPSVDLLVACGRSGGHAATIVVYLVGTTRDPASLGAWCEDRAGESSGGVLLPY